MGRYCATRRKGSAENPVPVVPDPVTDPINLDYDGGYLEVEFFVQEGHEVNVQTFNVLTPEESIDDYTVFANEGTFLELGNTLYGGPGTFQARVWATGHPVHLSEPLEAP